MSELKVERNGRTYNGRPTILMNLLYDQLMARDPSIINQDWWAVFSLYLARSCGVVGRKLNQEFIEAVREKLYMRFSGNTDRGLIDQELDKLKQK